MFKDLNVVIGITGGIAAYKACGIVSYLKSEGANVDVIMTRNACEFIFELKDTRKTGEKRTYTYMWFFKAIILRINNTLHIFAYILGGKYDIANKWQKHDSSSVIKRNKLLRHTIIWMNS